MPVSNWSPTTFLTLRLVGQLLQSMSRYLVDVLFILVSNLSLSLSPSLSLSLSLTFSLSLSLSLPLSIYISPSLANSRRVPLLLQKRLHIKS